MKKQAKAEPGQAQLKLGLDFNSMKICYIKLLKKSTGYLDCQ